MILTRPQKGRKPLAIRGQARLKVENNCKVPSGFQLHRSTSVRGGRQYCFCKLPKRHGPRQCMRFQSRTFDNPKDRQHAIRSPNSPRSPGASAQAQKIMRVGSCGKAIAWPVGGYCLEYCLSSLRVGLRNDMTSEAATDQNKHAPSSAGSNLQRGQI